MIKVQSTVPGVGEVEIKGTVDPHAIPGPGGMITYPEPEPTVMGMLNSAVMAGKPIEYLKELLTLKAILDEQEEKARQLRAQQAYDVALTAAKETLPVTVEKRGLASFSLERGGQMSYRYTGLDDLLKDTVPILAKHGLVHRFDVAQEQERVTVTCYLRHRDGHSQRVSMSGALDKSGGKNIIQALGSTTTYLRKYTFECLLGIVGSEDDDARALNVTPRAGPDAMQEDDGAPPQGEKVEPVKPPEPLSNEQRAEILIGAHAAAKQGEQVFYQYYRPLTAQQRQVLNNDELRTTLREEMNAADEARAPSKPNSAK